MALLDLLTHLAPGLGLRVIVAHANHGIRPGGEQIAQRLAEHCRRLDVPYHTVHLGLASTASETQAREARYSWLRQLQADVGAEFLVTAHHRDDQVETVLLRMLNGSGVAGLAGMRPRGPDGVRRPLLPFGRAALLGHVEQAGLTYEEDPMNADLRFPRARVRHRLLPALLDAFGEEAEEGLLSVAEHAWADRCAWDDVIDELSLLDARSVPWGVEVARAPLARYDKTLSQALLRALARRVGLVLDLCGAQRIIATLDGESGRRVELGDGWIAETAFDRLRLHRRQPVALETVNLQGGTGQVAWGSDWEVGWRIESAPARIERAAWVTWVPANTPLEWRPAQTGDRLTPLGGVGRRSVARLLMEARVPRFERSSYPVLTVQSAVVWVPGVCRGAGALPTPGDRAVRVNVQYTAVSQPDGRSQHQGDRA